MSDRSLFYTLGALHFAWRITSDQIEVYSMVEGKVDRRLGMLTTKDEDGETVEFEQEPFELHCQWFALMAAEAKVEDVTPDT